MINQIRRLNGLEIRRLNDVHNQLTANFLPSIKEKFTILKL